ncbi:hypothetical protein N1851_019522 [Merluccius polli]|uniref:Uncharacterized protein n=1 Tax=Merluccius polli TaxID=89951 RepID=A0AA47MM71_MERPO|nr:hypothetical protein N1851_019522 [Merluccius polli]
MDSDSDSPFNYSWPSFPKMRIRRRTEKKVYHMQPAFPEAAHCKNNPPRTKWTFFQSRVGNGSSPPHLVLIAKVRRCFSGAALT